eukprot:12383126-Karenia_brevis.AAC.1
MVGQEIDVERAKRILEDSGVSEAWDWSQYCPPSPKVYENIIQRRSRRCTHSAPGKDGIPIIAWGADPPSSARTSYDVSASMRDGIEPPNWFAAPLL